jgi:hypothetical protein
MLLFINVWGCRRFVAVGTVLTVAVFHFSTHGMQLVRQLACLSHIWNQVKEKDE